MVIRISHRASPELLRVCPITPSFTVLKRRGLAAKCARGRVSQPGFKHEFSCDLLWGEDATKPAAQVRGLVFLYSPMMHSLTNPSIRIPA
jgi:hypothetical protein